MPPDLQKTAERRKEIVDAVAQHLVVDGFRNSGLRALAKSIGISDRMVLYYFETKEDLIAAAISTIGESLADGMEQSLPAGLASASQVLDALLGQKQTKEVKAILQLWFEIVGLAIRGDEPYKTTASLLLSSVEARIKKKLRSGQKPRAREVLASLEGELMIRLLKDE